MTRGHFDDTRLYLDKWQMYLAVTDADIAGLHVPDSLLLSDVTIDEIGTASTWFVKPIHTWGGHHISKIEKQQSGWTLCNLSGDISNVGSRLEMLYHLQTKYPPSKTIVQKEAPVETFQGCPFDIRVLCQRTVNGAWLIAGMVARVGRPNGIVSNIGTGKGRVLPATKLLRQLYQDSRQMRRVQMQIRQVSHDICQMLDTYYEFDEVGIDFGLDSIGQLWLFEVNTNDKMGGPSHDLFKLLPTLDVYNRIEDLADARRHQWLQNFVDELFGKTKQE